jgi:ABC-2 type transport system ATP-binding protein
VGASAVETDRLVKNYREVAAVRGVSFAVAAGEIFGFLGPNGAGKSTTIKMLCTLARPSAGWARVAGFDAVTEPREVRRRIGVVFQDQTLDGKLTAEENLRFHAVLYGVPRALVSPRIDRVLALVDLTERRRSLVSTYSGGMARRLEIARALLHTPAVLFLDEPTVGLDPQTRTRIWADVRRLREQEQVTVFFTTHYMDEAEYADRIAIIDHGQIVATDTPAALKTTIGPDTVRLATADDAAAATALAAAGITATVVEGGLVVRVDDGERAVAGVIAAARVPVRQVGVHRPTLDDVFLHYTRRAIRDEPVDGSAAMSRRMMTVRARR